MITLLIQKKISMCAFIHTHEDDHISWGKRSKVKVKTQNLDIQHIT